MWLILVLICKKPSPAACPASDSPEGIGIYTSREQDISPSFGRVGKERQRVSGEGSIRIRPSPASPDPLPEDSFLLFDPPQGG